MTNQLSSEVKFSIVMGYFHNFLQLKNAHVDIVESNGIHSRINDKIDTPGLRTAICIIFEDKPRG